MRVRSVGLSPADFFSSSLFLFSILRRRDFDQVEFRRRDDVFIARRKNRGDFLLRLLHAVRSRRVRGENLGDASRVAAFFRFDLLKEAHEGVRIVPGFVHVLEAEVVRFASRRRA